MDFLDPKRKKAHRKRLLVGYVLVAVALSMATWLILNTSFGYWVDPKTGNIIQNGTVFVDSHPNGASVYLDGVLQGSKTASRLVLPGGKQYSIKLSLDGYKDWTRTVSLEGGKIERLTYPLFVPKELLTTDVQLYASSPGISSQSPDNRWLLVQQPGTSLVMDLYDLNNPSKAPAVITIPAGLLSEGTKPSSIKIVEWASDNHHVLLDREYTGKHEFLVIDTENGANDININTTLGVAPSSVSLRDKKADQLYLYNADGGILRSGNTKNQTISAPILSNVLSFDSYGSDIIIYATKEGAADGKTNFRLRDDDKATYLLQSSPDSANYSMDVMEYSGTPYFMIATSSIDAAFVYRDPLPVLKGQSDRPLMVNSVLRIKSPGFVSFSPGGQFATVQSGSILNVLDLETDRQYEVEIKHPIAPTTKLLWMDTHRLAFVDGSMGHMIDFDGNNEQPLTQTLAAGGPYLAPDSKTIFSFAPSAAVSGRYAFTQTSLVNK